MKLEVFTKALADQTRLRIFMLLSGDEELCVCELTQALVLSQPKISRHLSILRDSKVLMGRKSGLWVYYRLHPDLPQWALDIAASVQVAGGSQEPYIADKQRLAQVERENTICPK